MSQNDTQSDKTSESDKVEFQNIELEQNLIVEFWGFLKENKKFWLIPIIVVMLLLGLLIVFGGSSAAPFIYTLF